MKHSVTLNLNDAEFEALSQLAKDKDMSKTAVLKQALRLYQLAATRGQSIRVGDETILVI